MNDQPQACFLTGGWEGHFPKECAAVFAPLLEAAGFSVSMHDSLDVLADDTFMDQQSLIVPVWTMGKISEAQWAGLDKAIHRGCGLAGFHGGVMDAFRECIEYQWMTGAQFVAHPGNSDPTYEVKIADDAHPITQGLKSFTLKNTEQYYCHHDPGNRVLCTITFDQGHGDTSRYHQDVVMPYAWTKTWGAGKVFCAAWGHSPADFEDDTAREIVRRGMLWAAGRETF